jgi:hypothetical protein
MAQKRWTRKSQIKYRPINRHAQFSHISIIKYFKVCLVNFIHDFQFQKLRKRKLLKNVMEPEISLTSRHWTYPETDSLGLLSSEDMKLSENLIKV